MNCTWCGSANTRVVETRRKLASVRRQRRCLDCKLKFFATELPDVKGGLWVRTRAGKRERWSDEKLRRDLDDAFAKIQFVDREMEIPSLVNSVARAAVQRAVKLNTDEITTRDINELTLEKLAGDRRYAQAFLYFGAQFWAKEHPRVFRALVTEFTKLLDEHGPVNPSAQ